jgi:hypothetical protein
MRFDDVTRSGDVMNVIGLGTPRFAVFRTHTETLTDLTPYGREYRCRLSAYGKTALADLATIRGNILVQP